MPLDIVINPEADHGKRIFLAGSLDSATSPELQARLDETLDPATQQLTLDMRQLTFLSSAGLRVLFRTKKQMNARKGLMTIVNVQPQIRRVFEIINALDDLQVFTSQAELDDYLGEMQRQVLMGR